MPRFLTALLLALLVNACSSTPTTSKRTSPEITENAAAHWLSLNYIAVAKVKGARTLQLVFAANGGITQESPVLDSFNLFNLRPVDAEPSLLANYPHLQDFKQYRLAIDQSTARVLLKGQLAVIQRNKFGQLLAVSHLQTGAVLDALYAKQAQHSQLGAAVTEQGTQFALWAPTAKSVSLQLYHGDKSPKGEPQPMTPDKQTGVWHLTSKQANNQDFYRYQLEVFHPASGKIEQLSVTDPYSLSLATNGEYSQVIDLNQPDSQPEGWQRQARPALARPEQQIIYELHIGDFSGTDASTSPEKRGKYAAFGEPQSLPMQHLAQLKQAGLNTIHLLPTFDIATINEDPTQRIDLQSSVAEVCQQFAQLAICATGDQQQSLAERLATLPVNSGQTQAVIEKLRAFDDYNWGYDPHHYTVPEGSYAQDAEGVARIREFRRMVQTLHNMGFRVVMDVVYNHTHAAGLQGSSLLDKIVPGYYQRLHPISGKVETSTCCPNTATERSMMGKLMTDSLLVWAKDYKIDGFRFDLMGHQPKSLMLTAREAVRELDPDTYFYGEGWNFGEVANNAQFAQATQLEMAGSEIGTFSDRLRDAVRGGNSFVSGDDYRYAQGLGNGLYNMPNDLQPWRKQHQKYLHSADQARIGLVGHLAEFPLTDADDEQVTGKDIEYGDQPTGYTLDPADSINYVSKHDNQTLWDNNQYRTAYSATPQQRVNMQLLSLAYPMYAQGIPFLHMGGELLRSKSFLRDSYDYGHWFNKVDFSKQTNNYNVGLPPAVKDEANWPLIRTLTEKNQGRDNVTPELIEQAYQGFLRMLQIRSGSPLFSLSSAEQIIQSVQFLNTGEDQQNGIIAMQINDTDNLDANWHRLLVVFNHLPQMATFTLPQASDYQLHPVLLGHSQARVSANSLTLPPLSATVFVVAD